MNRMSTKQPSLLPFLLGALWIFLSSGECTNGFCKNSGPAKASREEQIASLTALDSATDWLFVEDLDKFRAGRPMTDILAELRWRAGFVMTADCDGTTVTAVSYTLYVNGSSGDKIEVKPFYAIFENGRFVKFIRPLPDTETIKYGGSLASRPRQQKIGDYQWLVRAKKSEPLAVAELMTEAKNATPPPESVDPGLTVVYLGMRALHILPGPPAKSKDVEKHQRNRALRDQFNAARLKIGMTEAEVRDILKAKPLESANVEAGMYQVYGSSEWFEFNERHDIPIYLNILVVFRDGRAVVIESIDSGYDWRKKLAEAYTDLPEPAAARSPIK